MFNRYLVCRHRHRGWQLIFNKTVIHHPFLPISFHFIYALASQQNQAGEGANKKWITAKVVFNFIVAFGNGNKLRTQLNARLLMPYPLPAPSPTTALNSSTRSALACWLFIITRTKIQILLKNISFYACARAHTHSKWNATAIECTDVWIWREWKNTHTVRCSTIFVIYHLPSACRSVMCNEHKNRFTSIIRSSTTITSNHRHHRHRGQLDHSKCIGTGAQKLHVFV